MNLWTGTLQQPLLILFQGTKIRNISGMHISSEYNRIIYWSSSVILGGLETFMRHFYAINYSTVSKSNWSYVCKHRRAGQLSFMHLYRQKQRMGIENLGMNVLANVFSHELSCVTRTVTPFGFLILFGNSRNLIWILLPVNLAPPFMASYIVS